MFRNFNWCKICTSKFVKLRKLIFFCFPNHAHVVAFRKVQKQNSANKNYRSLHLIRVLTKHYFLLIFLPFYPHVNKTYLKNWYFIYSFKFLSRFLVNFTSIPESRPTFAPSKCGRFLKFQAKFVFTIHELMIVRSACL